MKNLTEDQIQKIRDVFEARPNYNEVYLNLAGTEWLWVKKPLYPVAITRDEIMNNNKVSGKLVETDEKANQKEVAEVKNPNTKKK